MCSAHCRCDHTDHMRSAGYFKQDWERLYRAAVLGSDRSRLLQRIENAEAAILKRSRSSSNAPGNNGKEQDATTRALHILSLLRDADESSSLTRLMLKRNGNHQTMESRPNSQKEHVLRKRAATLARCNLLLGCSRILGRVGSPDVQEFLVTRRYNRNIFLTRYAVQSRAKILHLLAVQAAQRNLDRLLGFQLCKVGENVRHCLAMFSFTALRNVNPIYRLIVPAVSVSSHFRELLSSEIVSVRRKSYCKIPYAATKTLCEFQVLLRSTIHKYVKFSGFSKICRLRCTKTC